MISPLSAGLMIAVAAGLYGCNPRSADGGSKAEAAILTDREEQLARRIAASDTAPPGSPLAIWILPRELREVSGLALTADGRLLAHNDQRGRVYVLDPLRGVVVKRFFLGEKGLRGDFEAIAVAGKSIYMLTSKGDLYQFEEGKDGAEVRSVMHDTRLGKECEFEGLAFDSANSHLVLPCKNVMMKGLKDQLVLYRWYLPESAAPRMSMLKIPQSTVIGQNAWKEFRPTDITIDPATGNYVMISAQEKGLVEITPTGEVVRSIPLPGRHPQAEGVAIAPSGILIVADEGAGGEPMITLYRWPLVPQ
ncbi:MAG: SdiA-regulated domain-containing protein [Gemmatimonadota bacterium]|nr:SdiA-regulated domain-containing protein [Gemmatimonadota bacterium]